MMKAVMIRHECAQPVESQHRVHKEPKRERERERVCVRICV